ncbi:MAG: hypothetical protein HZT40_19445 [Candidatus Thiothrix singaporensis]|uniref:Uncharacterized protein n=1 Tax=Candidatus Thiothrix singaporensis TaxID=2799669 RepID=A0A7L6AW47_9GAMM|nr:MAG: hypothetical protein HZT40_19445 [Candidatus Thiothrix singaporensis]
MKLANKNGFGRHETGLMSYQGDIFAEKSTEVAKSHHLTPSVIYRSGFLA